MSAGSDKGHSLRLNEYGECEVIHLPICASEEHDFFGADFEQKHEPMSYLEFTCPVGRYVSSVDELRGRDR